MRLPVEVQIRQDEMRRAATVREESESVSAPVLTLADDCAAMLQAWFTINARNGRILLVDTDVAGLCRRMRAVGAAPTNDPQTARKL